MLDDALVCVFHPHDGLVPERVNQDCQGEHRYRGVAIRKWPWPRVLNGLGGRGSDLKAKFEIGTLLQHNPPIIR
jgi:hypothetical protein